MNFSHLSLLTVLFAASLAGCLGDGDKDTDGGGGTPVSPISPLPSFNNTQPANVQTLDVLARLTDDAGESFPSGAGIWTYGDYVFGSGLGAGFFIADISDPTAPALLWKANVDEDDPNNNTITSFARDADVVAHPDGRLTLVLATQSNGLHVWDVTNPSMPEHLAIVDVAPNHNLATVPNTTFVFNSQSGGAGGTNDLIDLSEPRLPVVVGTYGTHGCHDISFFGSFGDAKFRAYCAGIDRTEIWDLDGFDGKLGGDFGIRLAGVVEDLQDSPVVGNPVFGSYPLRTLHHLAIVNDDASVLIIGDEQNGGGSPGGCFFHDANTGASSPTGALWFYDISDETAPVLQGWFSPPLVMPTVPPRTGGDPTTTGLRDVPNCTAHFGMVVPGEQKLVMAWYSAGVVLVDFSDPTRPVLLDQYLPGDGINTWDARIHGGLVFTGDIVRGMEVLHFG